MLNFGTCDLKYFPYPKKQYAARKPSAWIDVEMKDNQAEVMRPKYSDRLLMEAVNDYGGQSSAANLVNKKLDMFGNANSHYSMVNYDKKLNLIGNKLHVAASISRVYRIEKSDAQENKH